MSEKIGLGYRPIADILRDFNKPVDPSLISQKPVFSKGKKNGSVSYIHWYDLVSELNRICAGWSWEIRTQFLPDRCVIEGRLTIRAKEGEFFMESTGVEPLDSNGYGDPVYSAEASALRRAMAKFGYALDLWRDKEEIPSQHALKVTVDRVSAETFTNRTITQKQISLLYAIAKKESELAEEDVKHIINQYGYESTKDIKMDDFDPILKSIKTAANFLTLQQRKELADWWRIEKVSDAEAKQAIQSLGYESTAQIQRANINQVKSAILTVANRLVSPSRVLHS